MTAGAIATVHGESGGRAVLGIGRGDSALAHLGLAPAPVPHFENYLARVQGYLRGDEVDFQDETTSGPVGGRRRSVCPPRPRPAGCRGSTPRCPRCRSTWLPPVPKVIGVAARLGDGVNAAVGADPERVAWALDTARKARADAGLDPEAVSYGAFVNVVCDTDVDAARQMIRGGLSTFARFSVMHGTPTGPVSDEQRDVLTSVHGAYDMTRHTMSGSAQSQLLTDSFVDRFGIAGAPPITASTGCARSPPSASSAS